MYCLEDMIRELRAEIDTGHNCENPHCLRKDAIPILREIEGNEEAVKSLGLLMYFVEVVHNLIPGTILFRGNKRKSAESVEQVLKRIEGHYESDRDPAGLFGLGITLMRELGNNRKAIEHLGNIMAHAVGLLLLTETISKRP